MPPASERAPRRAFFLRREKPPTLLATKVNEETYRAGGVAAARTCLHSTLLRGTVKVVIYYLAGNSGQRRNIRGERDHVCQIPSPVVIFPGDSAKSIPAHSA